MTTTNPTGYCPTCKQKVLLYRGQMDAFLAIILLCCTGGIGLIVYLAIYYSKAEIYCVHCGTECQVSLPNQNTPQIPYQSTNQPMLQASAQVEVEKISYCPLCGAGLDRQNQNFCPSCGSKISES